jgi:hypothetical protein
MPPVKVTPAQTSSPRVLHDDDFRQLERDVLSAEAETTDAETQPGFAGTAARAEGIEAKRSICLAGFGEERT